MIDLTEEEQIIALKTWWRRNGWYVIGGVVIGLGAYFGWSIWKTHNQTLRVQASLNYEAIVDNLSQGNIKAADKQVVDNTHAQLPMPYSLLEKMLLSELEVKQQDLDQAVANLQQALTLSNDPFFQELSSVRLARLYLAQGKYQQALERVSLKNDQAASKNPEVFVARGDAYVALQDIENARAAYTTAWQLTPTFSPVRQMIGLLLADLPEELPQPLSETAK